MTYDSRTWTGRYPAGHFPHVMIALICPWFGIRIGTLINQDAYGLAIGWGRVPPAPFVATHKHFRSWVWWTAEQVLSYR